MFDIHNLHISHLDFKGPQSRGKVLLKVALYTKGLIQGGDGNDDIVLVYDVIHKHGVYDIGRYFSHITGEEKCSTFNLVQSLIDFVIAVKKNIKFQGPDCPVEFSLAASVNQNDGEWDCGNNQ